MQHLDSPFPEYEVVVGMQGTRLIIEPQIMVEIGNVHCFTSKGARMVFATARIENRLKVNNSMFIQW